MENKFRSKKADLLGFDLFEISCFKNVTLASVLNIKQFFFFCFVKYEMKTSNPDQTDHQLTSHPDINTLLCSCHWPGWAEISLEVGLGFVCHPEPAPHVSCQRLGADSHLAVLLRFLSGRPVWKKPLRGRTPAFHSLGFFRSWTWIGGSSKSSAPDLWPPELTHLTQIEYGILAVQTFLLCLKSRNWSFI